MRPLGGWRPAQPQRQGRPGRGPPGARLRGPQRPACKARVLVSGRWGQRTPPPGCWPLWALRPGSRGPAWAQRARRAEGWQPGPWRAVSGCRPQAAGAEPWEGGWLCPGPGRQAHHPGPLGRAQGSQPVGTVPGGSAPGCCGCPSRWGLRPGQSRRGTGRVLAPGLRAGAPWAWSVKPGS